MTAARVALAAALTLLAPWAPAQRSAVAWEEILVEGSAGRWLKAGSASAVVPGDEQVLHHPSQLFHAVPGIWISRGSGQEHLTAIRSAVLTGAGACGNFQLLEAGVPIRPPGFCNVNGMIELDLLGAASVGVLRGPAAAIAGAGALQGAVEVRPHGPEDPWQLRLSASRWGRQSLRARLGGGRDDKGWMLDAYAATDGGWRASSGLDEQKARFLYRWGEGRQLLVSATSLDQETAGYITGADAYADPAKRFTNPNPEARRDAASLRALLSLPLGRRHDLKVFARSTDMEFVQHFLRGDPLEQNGHRGVGAHWRFDMQGQSGRGHVALQVETEMGQAWLRQAADSSSCAPTADTCFPQGEHYDYQVDYLSAAARLDYEWDLDGRHTLIADLSSAQHYYDYATALPAGSSCPEAVDIANCRFTRPPSGSSTFDEVGWRLAVRRRLSQHLDTYLALARGQRPPQMTELYRLSGDQSVRDLRPPSARQAEFGIDWSWRTGQLRAALYSLSRKDDIVANDDRVLNLASTRSLGLELEWLLRLGGRQTLQGAFDLASHEYGYTDAGSSPAIAKGNQVDTAPPLTLSLRYDWNPADWLGFRAEVRHLSRYYTEPTNTHSYKGHSLLDLELYGEVGQNLQWSVRLDNALDEAYAERADYSDFGDEDRYFPGRPAAISLGLTWKPGR